MLSVLGHVFYSYIFHSLFSSCFTEAISISLHITISVPISDVCFIAVLMGWSQAWKTPLWSECANMLVLKGVGNRLMSDEKYPHLALLLRGAPYGTSIVITFILHIGRTNTLLRFSMLRCTQAIQLLQIYSRALENRIWSVIFSLQWWSNPQMKQQVIAFMEFSYYINSIIKASDCKMYTLKLIEYL